MGDLQSGLAKAGVPGARRHLFLCLGPDCCSYKEGEKTWDRLKSRVKDLDLPIMRTKAGCVRVCKAGPILIVYPEGIWYREVTPERLDIILEEHIRHGRPIRDWIMAVNDLGTGCGAAAKEGAVGERAE